MKKGFLIAIEGTDGSGKATQTRKLYERLQQEDYKVKKIEFPNYNSESSSLVKMYLNGDFGDTADDISPYIASTFYAVDRYASYMTEWKEEYEQGSIIICDRYTTSNMIHQASKIIDNKQKDIFLDWLIDLEYKIYGLPQPDAVIFLDMPPKYSDKLMKNRKNKANGKSEKDIHEKNFTYLDKSYHNSLYISKKYDWNIIKCIHNDNILNIDKIHSDIYEIVIESLKKQKGI